MLADILIKNGLVLTMDRNFTDYADADVAIAGSKIIAVGAQLPLQGRKVIDARGKLVMPGLINAHAHSAMVMMRGLADDLPLDLWWNKFIFPIEKKLLNPEFIRIGVSLAAIEMIKSGTTCFSDMYFYQDAAAEVCKSIGIRALLGEAVLDFPTPDAADADGTNRITEQLWEKWGKDELISISVAPHAPYSCGAENLNKTRALADRLGLPLHIHLAETASEVAEFQRRFGKTPVAYLAELGFLDERVMAIHCIHVTPQDIDLMHRHQVKVVHCQESNMKLASGYAPVVEMQYAGLTIALGTDGAASNNNLDMFDEMGSVAKFHKLIRSDPTVMQAKTVLQMSTLDAAKVIGRERDLGSLEVGKLADIIIIDLAKPHLTPLYTPYSHLVYSAGGGEVDTAIIHGKVVMENRRMLTIDEAAVLAQANGLARDIQAAVVSEGT